SGLPILAVGDWSAPFPSGLAQEGEREQLITLFQQLLALPNVVNVPDRAAIPEGLERLGISRSVVHERAPLTHEARVSGPVTFYLFANTGPESVRTIVSVESANPEAWPFLLDSWTGDIRPMAHFTRTGNRLHFPVTLAAGSTVSLALAPSNWAGHSLDASRQVLSLTRGEAFIDAEGQLSIRAFESGPIDVRLGNGKIFQSTITGLPQLPYEITSLDLEVEAWMPGETPSSIRKEALSLEDYALRPWMEDPGLKDLSGKARYHGYLDLPDWEANMGAILEVGEIFNTLHVRVNGRDLPPVDPLTHEVDLGGFLKPGRNKIELEVTTTLNNQLRVAVPEVFSINNRQPYGLPGTLLLRPYREISVP
ncbi:MAG TPA: hypothetical protein VJ960_08110, partial [Oceanipulchritudo sp.]|nr:hypothetical protein [Oceanipulchritudo sp.]